MIINIAGWQKMLFKFTMVILLGKALLRNLAIQWWLLNRYLLDHQWVLIKHIPVFTACEAENIVQIGFPASLSMFAITLTAPPHYSQISILLLKPVWIFVPGSWLVSCASVPPCPVKKACLALFRFAGVLSRVPIAWCRAPHGGRPTEGRPTEGQHNKFIGNEFIHYISVIHSAGQ